MESVSIDDSQISKNYENIKAVASASSRKLTIHSGAKAEPIELETQLYDRITEQSKAERSWLSLLWR